MYVGMQNSESKAIVISLQKVLEYCPQVYIEGGYYQSMSGITAGIIRVRVLIEGGSCMRKYGVHSL